MAVRCGDCKNYKQIDKDTGVGVCKKCPKERVLDITPKDRRIGCKFESK